MKQLATIVLLAAMTVGCGNRGGEAAVVIVSAASMKAAQMIQEQRRKNRGESYECSHFCTREEVPCGDDCLPYGSVCYVAPRRACYGGDPDAPEEPMPRQDDHPTTNRDMGIVFSPVY